ncbi:class D sortase [Anaerobacillus alkalilacustris]|uniref:Class D sortase n=1 Tax=Anaerobacillus alkalilacustris TaxID=393763 RepID=A0A1S2LHC8_9BACI|nr:class D sortase [Anaerobacillus alkalilacustris]OIJ11714.1 class D sortase [Anaerobacillus alkalilacustris]
MARWLTIILITAGVILVSVSLYQIFEGKKDVSVAMKEAETIVSQSKNQIETQEEVVFTPEPNDVIGIISIPKLNKELPIIAGTEEEQLKRGVGHFSGSKFPGQDGQIVLSGHRDTVFTGLGDLIEGDEIILKMEYGTYTYYLQKTYIVDADDLTVIDPTIDEEVLTLTTCYPFRYVGDAPERYIIDAVRK